MGVNQQNLVYPKSYFVCELKLRAKFEKQPQNSRATLEISYCTGSFFTPVKSNILCRALNFHRILLGRANYIPCLACAPPSDAEE
jgi:hypothetical protein